MGMQAFAPFPTGGPGAYALVGMGALFAGAVNYGRDPDNPPDIALGNIAVLHGWAVAHIDFGHLFVPLLIQLSLSE